MTGNDICKAIQENGLGKYELDWCCCDYRLDGEGATLAFFISERPTLYVAKIQDDPIKEYSYGYLDIHKDSIKCRLESFLSDTPKEWDD